MEQQIEQLLKEVKGNETLERLVKMNRNPNELFIERIRTMNKGQGNNNVVIDKGEKINVDAINAILSDFHTKMEEALEETQSE